MTPAELAIEHLRAAVLTARSVDATQTVVTVAELAALLDELDVLKTEIADASDTIKALETEITRTAVAGW